MEKLNKQKKITTVPLLCWDIYAEHLDTLLGRNKVYEKKKPHPTSKK